MYYAISKIKDEFGVYILYSDITPGDFDSNIYFIFDDTYTFPDIDLQYIKPFLDKKLKAFDNIEIDLRRSSDFYIIDNHWNILYSDYKQARLDMKIKLNAIGFDNLTEDDKKIVAKWFLVDRSLRDTVLSYQEQVNNSIEFHNFSTISRKNRLSHVMMTVYNQFTLSNINDILTLGALIMDLYIEFGIEGTLEGNNEGLFDYIEARVGTSYETNGLLNSGLTPIDYTLSDLVNYTMDILKFGFY